jgi:hypothetical protein
VSEARVENRQPSHAKCGLTVGRQTAIVRAAMHHGVVHAPHGLGALIGCRLTADVPGYAAHGEKAGESFAPSLPAKATSVREKVGATM